MSELTCHYCYIIIICHSWNLLLVYLAHPVYSMCMTHILFYIAFCFCLFKQLNCKNRDQFPFICSICSISITLSLILLSTSDIHPHLKSGVGMLYINKSVTEFGTDSFNRMGKTDILSMLNLI